MKVSRPKHLLALRVLMIGFYSLFTMKLKILQVEFFCELSCARILILTEHGKGFSYLPVNYICREQVL